jgi:predicted outer membrane protein
MGNMQHTDAGDVSPEMAAAGAFVSDADFASKAVAAGMAEIKFGALTDRKASRPEVKQFGVQMVQDHTKANNLFCALPRNVNGQRLRKWT